MEGKVKKLLVATGALMSAAIALVPLTTYARVTSGPYGCGTDTDPATGKVKVCASGDGTTEVNVNVHPTLAFKVKGSDADCMVDDECEVTDGSAVQIYPYQFVESGKFGVELRSAKPYTVSLSAAETALVNEDNDDYLIRARADVAVGKSGWGIKKLNSDKTPVADYTAISSQPLVFFDSGTNVSDDYSKIEFPFGVSVTNNVPQGTYKTEVTITAAVKE